MIPDPGANAELARYAKVLDAPEPPIRPVGAVDHYDEDPQ